MLNVENDNEKQQGSLNGPQLNEPNYFTFLPKELLYQIFSFLTPQDRARYDRFYPFFETIQIPFSFVVASLCFAMKRS
jgi:hypothetical protein